MKFPSAFDGVKKIYTAEILSLIVSVLVGLAAILGLAGAVAAEAGSDGGALASFGGLAVLGLAASVLGIISFIMKLVGINRAKLDEGEFQKAFLYVILGIVLSFVSGFFNKKPLIASIVDIVSSVLKLLVTLYIISGIINLANRLNDRGMAESGRNTLKLYLCAAVLAIIVDLVSTITLGKGLQEIYNILGIVAAVLSIVSYIVYLRYLSKAKYMLAQ